MNNNLNVIEKIKTTVQGIEPTAKIILYGSYARGDFRDDSDIDILVLIDSDKPTPQAIKNIHYLLYDIEFEEGIVISPLVLSKNEWESKHRITPFYENILKEGKFI